MSTRGTRSYDIFLSHNSRNKNLVGCLYHVLKSRNYRVWYDENLMERELFDYMKKGINASKLVLVCLTDNFLNSTYCQFEINFARRMNKIVITLILEGENDLTTRFNNLYNAPVWSLKYWYRSKSENALLQVRINEERYISLERFATEFSIYEGDIKWAVNDIPQDRIVQLRARPELQDLITLIAHEKHKARSCEEDNKVHRDTMKRSIILNVTLTTIYLFQAFGFFFQVHKYRTSISDDAEVIIRTKTAVACTLIATFCLFCNIPVGGQPYRYAIISLVVIICYVTCLVENFFLRSLYQTEIDHHNTDWFTCGDFKDRNKIWGEHINITASEINFYYRRNNCSSQLLDICLRHKVINYTEKPFNCYCIDRCWYQEPAMNQFLNPFDCFQAGGNETCSDYQNVPGYIHPLQYLWWFTFLFNLINIVNEGSSLYKYIWDEIKHCYYYMPVPNSDEEDQVELNEHKNKEIPNSDEEDQVELNEHKNKD